MFAAVLITFARMQSGSVVSSQVRDFMVCFVHNSFWKIKERIMDYGLSLIATY